MDVEEALPSFRGCMSFQRCFHRNVLVQSLYCLLPRIFTSLKTQENLTFFCLFISFSFQYSDIRSRYNHIRHRDYQKVSSFPVFCTSTLSSISSFIWKVPTSFYMDSKHIILRPKTPALVAKTPVQKEYSASMHSFLNSIMKDSDFILL